MFAGVVAKFGLSALLIGAAIFVDRLQVSLHDGSAWFGSMDDPQTSGWFVLHGINFASAAFAGAIATWVTRTKSLTAAAVLAGLALLAVFFAQFPRPASPLVLALWGLGAPLGVLVGALLFRRANGAA